MNLKREAFKKQIDANFNYGEFATIKSHAGLNSYNKQIKKQIVANFDLI